MIEMRDGILAGGNWIIDQVKIIDAFPEEEKLVNILDEFSSNGGSPYNILKDLAKLEADFPLSAVGLVGDDNRGDQIIKDCLNLGIKTTQILKMNNTVTSYTDVMTVKATGKRTFFHYRGANAFLNIKHFNFAISSAKIFHLGYLLLLNKLDIIEDNGQTRASIVLQNAQAQGLLTSVDIVSENSSRYTSVIPPSLRFVDYLFVNEYEAGKITQIQTLSQDGRLLLDNCYLAASKLVQMGVKKWVILHFPSGAIAVNYKGEKIFQPGLKLPVDKIAGAVGAGDAFASGVLMGIHNDEEMKKSLMMGVCAAAASLFSATSSDSIHNMDECLVLPTKYGFGGQ
jgi:sugar/nucleoside kinase (ribokinase family)